MSEAPVFKQEFKRVSINNVLHVSQNQDNAYPKVIDILNDTSWEIVSVTDQWMMFRRYTEGQYAR